MIKIRSVEAQLFHAGRRKDRQKDRQTDRHEEANSRFSQFWGAPKMSIVRQYYLFSSLRCFRTSVNRFAFKIRYKNPV